MTLYFYVAAFIAIVLVIFKIYLMLTLGKHTIKHSLKGKVALITGASAGIGRETVRELAKHGATIHILARDLKKAQNAIDEIETSTGNQDIHIHFMDLNNFSTIRSFAKGFLETGSPIHILINNAGLANGTKKLTVDGNEETTQTNHLGHFLLTRLLLDRIVDSAPARIINVSSLVHLYVRRKVFDVHDINFEKKSNQWNALKAYSWSKLMNVLFTRELAHRLYGKGVTVNALHPGTVRTELVRAKDGNALFYYLSPNEGAQTTLYLATAHEVEHVSGHYFSDCNLSLMSSLAVDDQLAKQLWQESERLTGLDKK